MLEKITVFFKEAYAELKKVTWLTRKEIVGSTIVIIILILILSVFVSLIDFAFLRFVKMIL